MKTSELRKKTDTELKETLQSLQSDIKDVVKGVLQAKEKNNSKIKMLKKDIARVRTILNEKKILLEINTENLPEEKENE